MAAWDGGVKPPLQKKHLENARRLGRTTAGRRNVDMMCGVLGAEDG
jgi:hypothetical protein